MQLLISRSSSTLFLIYLFRIQHYITYYLTNWIFLLAAFIYQVRVSIETSVRGLCVCVCAVAPHCSTVWTR